MIKAYPSILRILGGSPIFDPLDIRLLIGEVFDVRESCLILTLFIYILLYIYYIPKLVLNHKTPISTDPPLMDKPHGEIHHKPHHFGNSLMFFGRFWRGGVGYEGY